MTNGKKTPCQPRMTQRSSQGVSVSVSEANFFPVVTSFGVICVSFSRSIQFPSEFNGPPYADGLNKASSAKTFSTRVVPSAAGAHWAETAVGKAWMVGSIISGIWGSGLRGRVTPTSPVGTSGKAGRVVGWSMAGSVLTVPSGSSCPVSCSCSW